MFVRQLLAAGRPVAFNPLHVDARSASAATLSYTATVVSGKTTVDGFAEKNGHPCPGAFVLLVPADELQHPHNWRTQQTDLDGSFDLSAVGPGKYLLFVIEEGWALNWHDGSVLQHYISAATPVQVEDSTSNPYHLPQPIPVQPRQ
jgi:hypothetical protein